MDFDDTPEEAAFRSKARSFLDRNAQPRSASESRYEMGEANEEALARAAAWQAKVFDAGFACLTWPREFGGQAASPVQQVIWNQEEARFRTPLPIFSIQHGNLGPTLILWGTPEQKGAHLRRMARGDDLWCQLFSEPNAGSDLAALRTRAVRDGEGWRVDGQKIWTSNAAQARLGMLVARTDPSVPKHKGLTYFIVDMQAPGVTVRPIKTMAGESDFCEVFFDGVRIEDKSRIGGVGEGWRVSVTTLMNERSLAGGWPTPSIQGLMELAASLPGQAGERALDDAAVRQRIAAFQIRQAGLEHTVQRAHTALSQGREPGPENSIVKLVGARLSQEIHGFALELLGNAGPLVAETRGHAEGFLAAPGSRLAGGTDEILRNILAERVLGLPADPRADKGVPFEEIPTGR